MQPRVDMITLGVPDLPAARGFYLDGLGWEPVLDVPGEVVFIQIGPGRVLALFGADALEADISPDAPASPATGALPLSLAQIVATENEVEAVLKRAAAAGATVLKSPQRAQFGGFHGYFADPAGFRWEIATNPGWSVDADGRVRIVAV